MLLTNEYLKDNIRMYRNLMRNGGGMGPQEFGEYQKTRHNTKKSKKRRK